MPGHFRPTTVTRTVRWAALGLALLVLVGCVPVVAAMSPVVFAAAPPRAMVKSVFVRLPQDSGAGQTLRVVVVLHGIGGNGETFARDLTTAADKYGWVLVAPTI